MADEETTPATAAEEQPAEDTHNAEAAGDAAPAEESGDAAPTEEAGDAPAEEAGDAPAEGAEQPAEEPEQEAGEGEAAKEEEGTGDDKPTEEAEPQEEVKTDEPAEEKPAEETDQPAEDKPAEETDQPAEDKPAEETDQPAEDKPAEEEKTGEEEAAPTEAADEPEKEAEKAADEPEKAAEEPEKAAEEAAKDDGAEKPDEPEPAPEKTEEPAAEPEAEKSAEEKPAEPEEPAEEKPAEPEKPVEPKVEIKKPTEKPAEKQVVKEELPAQKAPAVRGINLEATATVKFVLMPSGQVVTMACQLGQTLTQLKQQFANELKMPVNLIMLMFDGKMMGDDVTLADLGVGPNGTVQLEMQSADPVNNPIRNFRLRQEYQMPDVITVRVQTEGEAKDVVVEIERATSKKPFLGGFRHKALGIEFHNAAAQTNQKPKPPSGIERFCRDTQTCEQRHRIQQTFNDTSTQMTGVGVYISNMEDKLLTPGKYILADAHLDMILRNVIIMQKYYRRWLAIRYVNKLKEDKRRRLEWERLEEIRKQKEKEDRIKREFERRMHPKTKEDFDLLYAALEKWRLEELERINSTLTGAERKAALCMLLDQETQLLSAIDRHKLETGTDNKQTRIQDFLDKAASAKKWRGFDGKVTEMDTPYTLRAKELREIYNSINMKYLTQDERLDVLLTLKHTVKEHDCKLTQEIIELIDREADLLMRGVKEGNLTGLRKRISTLFLQYIKTPTFNPEAARLLKVPQDPSTLRKNIYFCSSCEKYLASTDFYLSSNSRTPGKCRNCLKVDNEARLRQDLSHYRRMLKALRRSEETFEDNSQIAFLMQEGDLRYLVENIWSGQSILSAWKDLYDLVLVRWDKHSQWSPWNCILITQDEAKSHEKLVSLDEGYGEVFIHKVQQKHTLARNYFSRLPGMAELIRKHTSGEMQTLVGPSTIAGNTLPMQNRKVQATLS